MESQEKKRTRIYDKESETQDTGTLHRACIEQSDGSVHVITKDGKTIRYTDEETGWVLGYD